jgi:hypothetical protein
MVPAGHRGIAPFLNNVKLYYFISFTVRILRLSHIFSLKGNTLYQNSPPSRMSETEDFKPNIDCKTASFSLPSSSRATSAAPSIIPPIPGNSENPIIISDSDGDDDWFPPSAKELDEKKGLNHVKEEPKDSVLVKSLPVKREY